MKKTFPAFEDKTRYQDRLPSVYETLIERNNEGFNAGLTVDEAVAYLGMKTAVPESIRKIKLGSFTPLMFDHASGAEFWKTPVPEECISDALNNALNDEQFIEVQMDCDYEVDRDHVTLETLARLAQTQYIGFQTRMGELTSQNMFDRLEKLKDPVFYERLRNCPYTVKNGLQDTMPKDPPTFEVAKQEFSVKSVKSSIGKAYGRTGKPKNAEAFFANPDKHGVFAITDMQRTTLKFTKSGAVDRTHLYKDYTNLRNVVSIAALSGELGIIVDHSDHCEVSDQVLCPGIEAKDQMPVMKINGINCHAGPKGSHITTRLEIQVQVMEDHLVDMTHKAYELYRDIKDTLKNDEPSIYGTREERENMCDNLNDVRIGLFNSALPADILEIRKQFLENSKVASNDLMGLHINKNDVLGNNQASVKRAIEVAYEEFPDREDDWNKSIVAFDPFQRKLQPVLARALRDIISVPKEHGTVIEMHPAKTTTGISRYKHS